MTKELLGATSIGKLPLPRWDGPFTVTACPEKVSEYDTAAPRRRAAIRGELSIPRRMRGRIFLWPRRGFGWRSWPRLWLARR